VEVVMSSVNKLLAAGVLTLGLCACEPEGPLERFGEEVDESVEDVREGGETLGNRIDDAADDVREGVEEAREEIER
jgi:hypothetical protein